MRKTIRISKYLWTTAQWCKRLRLHQIVTHDVFYVSPSLQIHHEAQEQDRNWPDAAHRMGSDLVLAHFVLFRGTLSRLSCKFASDCHCFCLLFEFEFWIWNTKERIFKPSRGCFTCLRVNQLGPCGLGVNPSFMSPWGEQSTLFLLLTWC